MTAEQPELVALRSELNEIDQELVTTLKKRFAVVAQVGRIKQQHDLPVHDGAREQVVLDRIAKLVDDPALVPAVTEIYQAIFTAAKAAERTVIAQEEDK